MQTRLMSRFSTFANPIIHLFYPPPPLKKNLHRHCIRFLLAHEDDPREIENKAYANVWGVKEVYYGICESRKCNEKGQLASFMCQNG